MGDADADSGAPPPNRPIKGRPTSRRLPRHGNLGASVTMFMAASADQVWSRISDVTRIGQFSPETFEAEWLDGATGPAVGVRFRGHVHRNGRGPTYWSVCTVTECEPGRLFSFAVGVGDLKLNTWRYEIVPADEGVHVTESFELTPSWANRIYWAVLGRARGRTNVRGMRITLERIKHDVEANPSSG
jgi:Polyketide cyclase / dehydrase and lipid transport